MFHRRGLACDALVSGLKEKIRWLAGVSPRPGPEKACFYLERVLLSFAGLSLSRRRGRRMRIVRRAWWWSSEPQERALSAAGSG
jgi:hypothetical protein